MRSYLWALIRLTLKPRLGLEGLVSKRRDRPYRGGRSKADQTWLSDNTAMRVRALECKRPDHRGGRNSRL